jgi:hypothetical protein
MRQTRAHLERKENGDIYAVFKLGFTKDASRFEYCFIGACAGLMTYDGKEIAMRHKFRNVDAFEGWCRKYCAEHDL